MNKKLKTSSLIVCSLALFGVTLAVGASLPNNDKVKVEALSGGGTLDNPYLIGSADDFYAFRNVVNSSNQSACGKLTSDITLTEDWSIPIGDTESSPFRGTFDGDGHSISGASYTIESYGWGVYYFGLFGYVNGGHVKNLTLAGNTSFVNNDSGLSGIGGIVGFLTGESSNYGTIENCHNDGVSIDIEAGSYSLAGSLVANTGNYASIISSSGSVTVKHGSGISGGTIGGLVGKLNADTSVSLSCFEGTLDFPSGTFNAGGIVGDSFGGTIINSYAKTDITKSGNRVGGIAGYQRLGTGSASPDFTNCHYYGTISASATNRGGIAGVGDAAYNFNNYYLTSSDYKGIGSAEDNLNKTAPLTSDEFKVQSNFSGWPFDADNWKMGKDYPILFGTPIAATVTGFNGDYDGQEHSINISVTEPATGYVIKYKSEPGDEYSSVNPSYHTAGTYTTYYKVTAEGYLDLEGSETITINKINPDYDVPTGLNATYGDTLEDVTLPAGWSWNDSESTSVGNAGNNSFEATFTPADTDNYNTVVENLTIAVAEATPDYEVPTGLNATYGETLEDVALPTGWSWNSPLATSVGNAGNNVFGATFTPADTDNYNTVIENITISVAKATPEYVIPTGLEATYGDTLADVTLPTGWSWSDPLTTSVGNVGNNEFGATFTPADADNYDTIGANLTISVAKAIPTFSKVPAAKSIKYSGVNEELVTAGVTECGDIAYKLGDEGSWDDEIPVASEIGEYKVWYKITENANYLESEPAYVTAEITAPDKSELGAIILEAQEFHDENVDEYPEACETLEIAINTAEEVFDTEPQTQPSIEAAIDDLEEVLSETKVEIVEIIIDSIGTITYTDECKDKIDEATSAFNSLSDSEQNAVSNKNVLETAVATYELFAHQGDMTDNGVHVSGKDGELIPTNVTLKVELSTSVKAEEGSTEYSNISNLLGEDKEITSVYDVKLIKTEGGVETEIQPSEIKEGLVLVIQITLPDGMSVEGLEVLHIHSDSDIAFVTNFTIENGKLTFEVTKLSEIAFVMPVSKAAPKARTGLPGWAIALIVIFSILLLICGAYFFVFFVFNKWIKEENEEVTRVLPFAFGKKDGKQRLFRVPFNFVKKDGKLKFVFKPFKFVYRDDKEVYPAKEDALKA